MLNKIHFLFYLRHQKTSIKGLTPIYLRLTISGRRIDLATGQFIHFERWNSEASKAKGYSADALKLNKALSDFQSQLENKIDSIKSNGKIPDYYNIKESLSAKAERKKTIVPIFEDHNKRIKSLIGKSFAALTCLRYETTLRHLKQFMKADYGIEDIEISRIDLKFINDFEYFLRTVRNCENNSAVKYVSNFGKIINQCISYGWMSHNPFLNYKSRVILKDKDFLSTEELEILASTPMLSERLEMIRDIFVFSCYTGLPYIDTKNLTQDNIVIGIDGNKWIHTSRQKTNIKVRVPLLSIPLQIIEKYIDHPFSISRATLLPVYSNQKMNQHLKTIAEICGIDKELTYHMARHTFATTVTLSNNVPIETVSKMLGHTNLKITQHYAKILDKKISMDMNDLRAKIEKPANLVNKSELNSN